MGLFGFGKKKEREQPRQVEEPIENNAPVIKQTVAVSVRPPEPPEVANSPCPACQKPLGEYPVVLADSKICHSCSLLLRGDFYYETLRGVTYDTLSKMSLEKAQEFIEMTRQIIKGDLADLKQADKYSFIADLYDTEEYDYGCTCAKVIVIKGDNPSGNRATILDEEGNVLTYALIENAIPCAGNDFETSYVANEIDPDEWHTDAFAWLILAIEPSQIEDGNYIVLD